jgi:hypothetical protein
LAHYRPDQNENVVWSDDSEQRQYPYRSQHMKLMMYGAGVAAAAGAGFLRPSLSGRSLHQPGADRVFTHLYRATQVAEQFFPPVQWLKTFRMPSRLAPLAAPDEFHVPASLFYEEVEEEGGRIVKEWYGKEGFGADWISKVTGKSKGELTETFDIFKHGVTFRRTGAAAGDLWIGDKVVTTGVTPGRNAESMPDAFVRAHMSRHDPDLVARMEAHTSPLDDILPQSGGPRARTTKAPTGTGPIPTSEEVASKTAGGVEGLYNTPAGRPYEWTFYKVGKLPGEDTFPLLKKLGPGVEYIRSFGAFASQRLTTTIEATAERLPFIGSHVHKFMPSKAGFLKMQGKFAGIGIVAGGAYLALEQLDWFKRQKPVAGSGAYGVIAGGGALLAGASPQTALAASVGAAAITALPPFKGGLKQGAANLFMKAQQARSTFSNLPLVNITPVGHKWREWWEETMPQSTSPGFPILVGLAGAIGMAVKHNVTRARAIYGEVKPRYILGEYWTQFANNMDQYGYRWWDPVHATGKASSMIESVATSWFGPTAPQYGPKEPFAQGLSERRGYYEAMTRSSQKASATITQKKTPEHAYQRALDIEWANRTYHAGENSGWIPAMIEQIKGAFHGADVHKIAREEGWKTLGPGGIKRMHLGRYGIIAGTIATGLAFATGQFASPDKPEELRAKMEGDELLPVRKGRYWEGGGTPFEGRQVMYHRPHWYAMMSSRARQKAIWGEDEDDISPIGKSFRKNFTYYLEKKHYQDRPYPITGTPFSEAPFISGLISPIARLIKPPRLMHVDDWAMIGSQGDTTVRHEVDDLESQPAEELGGIGPGMPISPFAPRAMAGKQAYQWTEQAGLVGYANTSGFGINPLSLKSMTGMDSLYSQDNWLAEAGEMTSLRRWFWEQELGGMGFLSEPLRRFYPRRRSEIGQYNPIANTMPYWIPEDLRTGDPYAEVPYGEARMPGPGYAALNPELRGLAPEEYPIWHQYAILSDIAWWSKEFRTVESRVKALSQTGALPDSAMDTVQRAAKRLENRKDKVQFDRYIDNYNERTADWSFIRKAIGRTWQKGTHGIHRVTDPIEYFGTVPMFGFRPISKLLPQVSPIEEYERDRVYGTRMAFWDKLGRDAIRPGVWTSMRSLGYEGIPPWLQEVRENEQYVDQLEYYKWKNLENSARESGEEYLAKKYAQVARKTVHGRNPYERDMYVRASLPKKERDYFDAFINTTNPKERQRILELVPPSMRNIYVAQWQRTDYERTGDPDLKVLIDQNKRTAGAPLTEELQQQFQREAPPGMSYGDWWKLKQLEGMAVPRPDWVGFNPAVDLEDMKLKMVLSGNGDIQDYGLWDSQARMLARKPYINAGTIEPLVGGMQAMNRATRRLASNNNLPTPQMSTYEYYSPFPRDEIEIDMHDNRAGFMEGQRRLIGY